MAYMSQKKKKEIATLLKKEFGTAKQRGFKYTLAVLNRSTIVMNISAGYVDFIGNYMENATGMELENLKENNTIVDYISVNTPWINDRYTGQVRDILTRALKCLNTGNHDNSDIQTDYFDVGWYIDINIGKWNKPYQLLK